MICCNVFVFAMKGTAPVCQDRLRTADERTRGLVCVLTGSHPDAEFPMNVTIERCHFGQTGVYGKQVRHQ
jgi:hypothetical protein